MYFLFFKKKEVSLHKLIARGFKDEPNHRNYEVLTDSLETWRMKFVLTKLISDMIECDVLHE
jgi:hypothetical protein